VSEEGDPLDNLVNAFLEDAVESPTRYTRLGEKQRAIAQRVRDCRAEGVVFCAPSFCDPALLDQPLATRAVESAGVPWTAFKYAENSGQFQVIREQAGTFADSIKLWSGAA
jgi:benzoyl-CoA reductase subunit C